MRINGTRRATAAVMAMVVMVGASQLATAMPASASGFAAGVDVVATGTGVEDHGTPGQRDPGDDLSSTDEWVRTLDATTVELSYAADSGGSTNLVLTATINSPHAGFDLRGLDLVNGGNALCPGGAVVAPRNVLTCHAGNVPPSQVRSQNVVVRASAAAGQGHAFDLTVATIDDESHTASATSTTVRTSAAPRWNLQKLIFPTATPTGTSRSYEGIYALKMADADPLGVSALTDPVTFTDHVDSQARIVSCFDTSLATSPVPPTENSPYDPNLRLKEVDPFTCAGAPGTNGQTITVSMSGIDWERIYPPPTIANGISSAATGYVQAMLQYRIEVDDADVVTAGGQLRIGNAIGVSGYDSQSDAGVGPGTWTPVDVDGNPNLGSDDVPGEDDLSDNTASYLVGLFSYMEAAKYAVGPVVDGETVRVNIKGHDTGTTPWPFPFHVCDKFDNRRMSIVRAPNSNEAVENLTGATVNNFPATDIDYGRSSGWGPGAGASGTQWSAMAGSSCDPSDTTDGQFFTSAQADWTNSGNGAIDAEDINMVRFRPQQPFLHPTLLNAGYSLYVHFEIRDNQDGDFVVDYMAYDDDGTQGPHGWTAGAGCNGGSPGTCPDPPQLANTRFNQPGDSHSGAYVHVDTHPTINKTVVGPTTGTTPTDYRFRLDLNNTRVAGNTTARQDVTLTDVLPPGLSYRPE